MMRLVTLLFTVGLNVSAYAQSLLSKTAVIEDLRYWEAAVREGHPQVPLSGYDIAPLFAALTADERDSLDQFTIDSLLREATWQLGCTHTTVRGVAPLRLAQPYLPYRLHYDGSDLYLIGRQNDQATSVDFPFRVERINGRPVSELLRYSLVYAPADGYQPGYGHTLTNDAGQFLLRRPLHRDDSLRITGWDATGEARTFTTSFTKEFRSFEPRPAPGDFVLAGEIDGAQWGTLPDLPGTLWLRLEEFTDKPFRRFYRRLFAAAEEQEFRNLVIDLRRNGGGNRHHATHLLRYLLPERFGYRLVKPKSAIRKYVGWKAILLESIRFGLFELPRNRFGTPGREVRFRYRPHRRGFTGPVFVLTDERTASSASLVAAYLRRFERATIVGRETAGGVSGNNGGSFPRLTLPRTGRQITFPLYRVIYDDTDPENFRHHGVRPDISIDYRPEDLLRDHDPWRAALLPLLRNP